MSRPQDEQQRWPWLRFASNAVEENYRQSLVDATVLHSRIAMVVGQVLNVTYTLWDRLVFTEALFAVTIVREVVMTLFLFACLGVTFLPAFRKNLNVMLAIATFGYAVFFATINALEPTPYIFLANGILIFIFPYLFVAGQFSMACFAGVAATMPLLVITATTRDLDRDYLLFALLVVGTSFLGACVAGLLETVRRRAFLLTTDLEIERAKFRDLLVRVLPDKIADRLQRGEVVADMHPVVVVLFADIVGFTSIAARHSPDVLVAWLNKLFEKFDRAIESLGLEKIKTIGDAYMAAHGLAGAQGDCRQCAMAALDLLRIVKNARTPDGQPFQVRIGLHVGPAVAGIVGNKRFLYDLWGDTVNVASRMESASSPGAILVTSEARRQLAGFDFGGPEIKDIKGKGLMETWVLKGPFEVTEKLGNEQASTN